MITKDNLPNLLKNIGFHESQNIWTRQYNNGASITVDFNKLSIEYAPIDNEFKNGEYPTKDKPSKGFIIHRDTTLNFNANENFVCLVCVHLLLEKGYEPKHIVFEPSFQVGHVNKPSYGDILVFDKEYKPLVLIENKTYGKEFSAEWNNMQKDGGQLFSYLPPLDNKVGLCEYVALFASDFEDRLVLKSHIITLKDNDKHISELENPLTFKNRDPSFEVWDKTYAKSFETKGLFEDDIAPYSIGKQKYTIRDLKGLSHAEIRPIYHEFATILRNHAITDFEHSFYILIDLFLCKITDERNNPEDLQFYYKGISRDTPKEYCSRLLKLYQQGKKELFGVDVVNKEECDIRQIFDDTSRSLKNGLFDGIKELFEEIKFYNIKKFNFIDVENREEFELNFQILIKITALIQDINLSNSETNHFFGDLFEGLLSKNVHQTEGQFFTPLPIVNFIIKSLPEFENSKYIKVLDYACGAGHFLTEFIKAYPNSEVFGIEKSQPLSQVAKIATIINGAKENSHIVFKDALSILNNREIRFEGFDKESFDCIIANPPYSVKGFLSTLTKNERDQFDLMKFVDDKTLDSKRNIECFFIERAKHYLKPHGVIGIVLPSSVLSNGELYIKARELLFESFNILSIVSLGSRTFGSTGTNTIILFAQKVKKNSQGLVNTFIEKNEYEQYVNSKALEDYIEKQNYDKHEYFAFMQDETLNGKLENHEIFVDYKKNFKKNEINKMLKKEWFKNSSLFDLEIKENSKEYKMLLNEFLASDEYKSLEKNEYRKQFIAFAKEIEKDKLNTFIQVESNSVVILQSPPDKDGNKSNKAKIVEFLGYDWSNRKGDEGIKYVVDKSSDIDKEDDNDEDESEFIETVNSIKYIKTPLYNPNDNYDYTKYAFALRKHMCEKCNNKFSFKFEPSEKLKEYFAGEKDKNLHYANLSEMIDFSKTEFDKTIKINVAKEQIVFKSKFPSKTVDNLLVKVEGEQTKIKDKEILSSGAYPVITQESERIISGYTNNDKCITDLPLIVFGDHTCIFKYVDFPFIRGADGTQILKTRQDEVITKYLYYYLSSIQIENQEKYERHFKYLKTTNIPLPPLDIQKTIVAECEKIDSEYISAQKSIEETKFKINEVMNNVDGVETKLDDLCESNIGLTYKPQSITSNGSGTIVLRASNIQEGHLDFNDTIRVNCEIPDRCLVQDGDVLVCVRNGSKNLLGKSAYIHNLKEPMAFGAFMAICRSKLGKWIYCWMNSTHYFKQLNDLTKTMSVYQLTQKNLLNLLIPVPSLGVQTEIISQIEKLEAEINKAKEIISTIAERKKSVLDKYLL